MFEELIQAIRQSDTIILHRHSFPDGDALGSQIGLKHILRDSFPDKQIYAVGDGAGRYGFMEDCTMDEVPDSAFSGALSIILDCGAAALVSDTRYSLAARTARIDHHTFSGSFTDTEVIDTSFESCCGMIVELALEQGLTVSSLAAKSLFTGMVTDSGRFRYDSTSPRTFRQAAFLMEQKFDVNEVYLDLYADDFDMKRLRSEFVLKIRFTPNNVAYIYTTAQELEALHQDTFTISRGMVNTMADIRGVEIWANFTETPGGVLCELRSSRQSIVHIATKYGGGGHAKACGATVPSREVAMQLLDDLNDMIKE